MYRDTHCPNCFKEPAPAGQCRYCGFDARAYSTYERNHFLPLFTSLENKYILGRVLGQGGLGIVYAGYQNLERQVAIKEFFPHTDSLRVDRRGTTVIAPSGCETLFNTWKDDFLEEAKLLAKFDHPHVVRVLTIEYANNTAYLVTERLQGCTLSDYLDGLKKEKPNGPQKAGRKLDSNEVLNLLNVALDILDVLHGHQPKPVIHRDLTPNNLFLVNREPEQLKVLDFGLARLGEGPASTIGGTNPFASPEQIGVINNDITSATDFYNLGASLYTALAGVTPPAAARRHNQPLLSLSSLPNVDPTLATIIRDCLEMDPSRRPKDVAEIRQRLAARTELPPKDQGFQGDGT